MSNDITIVPESDIHFDYEQLDKLARDVVLEKTAEIRERFNRAAENIVEIGQRLLDVKAALPHGKFREWLDVEFDWNERTARRMMSVAEAFKTDTLSDLKASPSALYLIASESTPQAIRDEFKNRVIAGEPVKCLEVRAAISETKHDQQGDTKPAKTRQPKSGISPRAMKPIRGLSNPEKMVAFNLPTDPERAAAAICRTMGKEYLTSMTVAAAMGDASPPDAMTKRETGRGIRIAYDAINLLKSIPPNDRLRDDGLKMVASACLDWVSDSKNTPRGNYRITHKKYDEIANALTELDAMSKKSSHQVSMIEVRRIVECAVKAFSGVRETM